ncbi:MAG TPA: ACT domain-containing protein [Gemmatimonadaceae bacterium]|nr:ACT domain-containing protein [Gemmatimonadaceae bacterium]
MSLTRDSQLVLAALGTDRPGLVSHVTRYVAERGGNVEDSRMVALGGVFGLMLLITAGEADAARITGGSAALEAETGMRVLVQDASDAAERGARTLAAILLRVTARGFDHEGLLMEIADVMRSTGGNIVELDTTTYEGVGGDVFFQLDMTVSVDSSADVDSIQRGLSAIATRERIYVEVKLAERDVQVLPQVTVG